MHYRFVGVFTWGTYTQAEDDSSQHGLPTAFSDMLMLTEGAKYRDLRRFGLIAPDCRLWVGFFDDPELPPGTFSLNEQIVEKTILDAELIVTMRPAYYRSHAFDLVQPSNIIVDTAILAYTIGYEVMTNQPTLPQFFTRTRRIEPNASTEG